MVDVIVAEDARRGLASHCDDTRQQRVISGSTFAQRRVVGWHQNHHYALEARSPAPTDSRYQP